MKPFDFKDLFILDLANNHQGDIEHARRIFASAARSCAGWNPAAFKFQFRESPFVHPAHRTDSDKQASRGSSPRLKERIVYLADEVRAADDHDGYAIR